MDNQFSWIGESWQRELLYLQDTMVTEVTLHKKDMNLLLICHDAVDFHEDIYLKEIIVENLASRKREIRLFFHLDMGIAGNDLGDLVKKAADFMCQYRDTKTGLPLPSYDLWEERRGILSFTVGAVFGGLTAASLFCEVFGEEEAASYYQQVVAEVRDGASNFLWREDLQRFCRMVYHDSEGNLKADGTCDSSIWGLFAFGMYNADDTRLMLSMDTLRQQLWVKTRVGGMARYEDDPYLRVSQNISGNPWFICTLWLADYLIEKAKNDEDMNGAINILSWVTEHALPSGVLAEQINAFTGEPISVSPLTWSHATYITTIHRLLRQLTRKKAISDVHLGREDWITRLFNQTCDSIHGTCEI